MRLLRIIFRNLPIKIVALLVAAIVWLYAVLERPQVVSLEMPVTIGKVPSGMVAATIDTSRARALLTGKGRDLVFLRLRPPAFRLNLSSQNAGRSRIKLTEEHSTLPATVQIKQVKPEYVNVDLDLQARRNVKVNVPLKGKPADGMVVTGTRVLETVVLSGPQEEISLIPVINTESLNLADITEDRDVRLKVARPTASATASRFSVVPDSVTVTVRLEKEELRTFPNVSITILKPARLNVTVQPPSAQILIAGAATAIRGLTVQDISATIKIVDTIPLGRYKLPCEIVLPSGVTLVKCEPTLFDVEIK